MEFPTTLEALFKFVGSPLVIGAVISFLAENWDWFQTLESRQAKVVILVVLSGALGVLSYVLVTYMPQGIVDALNPLYGAALTGFMVLIATQVWHRLVNTDGLENTDHTASG